MRIFEPDKCPLESLFPDFTQFYVAPQKRKIGGLL